MLYYTINLYYLENKLFDNLSKKGEYELRNAEKNFYQSVERKMQNPDENKISLKKVLYFLKIYLFYMKFS